VRETSPAPREEGAEGAGGIRGPFLQVARTYLLRALPDGFEIVDQHALHERLTFEELKRDVASGAVAVQRLLVPEPVDVGPAQARLLESHQEALESIGIRLARFGEATVSVDGIPARLRRADVEGLVRDVLEIVQRTGKAPDAEEVLEEVLHSAACRSSIMAGDRLDDSEIRSLLERAAALESDQTCPHARPTRVRFTTADLEKAFHRR
jgi:DNA mismatch repair protein MutL